MTQGLLLGVTGTHLEPTGSDAKGPEIEVCDSCRVWVEWKGSPGCATPEVHRWKDPGMDPEEGDEDVDETIDITPRLADEIAAQVDVCLALAGEGGDNPQALRDAIDAELGHGDFERWPEKRGKQVEFVEQLARIVMEKLGTASGPDEVKRAPSTVREGFDADTGNDIIKTPIGG